MEESDEGVGPARPRVESQDSTEVPATARSVVSEMEKGKSEATPLVDDGSRHKSPWPLIRAVLPAVLGLVVEFYDYGIYASLTNEIELAMFGSDTSIEASKEAPGRRNGVEVDQKVDVDNIDFTKKTLHLTWHPQRNAMAVAGLNNLYIYST